MYQSLPKATDEEDRRFVDKYYTDLCTPDSVTTVAIREGIQHEETVWTLRRHRV
jgi:hypothetical protein